jgi:hypothetical protein
MRCDAKTHPELPLDLVSQDFAIFVRDKGEVVPFVGHDAVTICGFYQAREVLFNQQALDASGTA